MQAPPTFQGGYKDLWVPASLSEPRVAQWPCCCSSKSTRVQLPRIHTNTRQTWRPTCPRHSILRASWLARLFISSNCETDLRTLLRNSLEERSRKILDMTLRSPHIHCIYAHVPVCMWTCMHITHNIHEERNEEEVAGMDGWLLPPGGRWLLRHLKRK